MASDFMDSASERGMALEAQAGATKIIPMHLLAIKTRGKDARCRLSQCVNGQSDVRDAWKSQSHAEKVAVKKKKPVPRPTP